MNKQQRNVIVLSAVIAVFIALIGGIYYRSIKFNYKSIFNSVELSIENIYKKEMEYKKVNGYFTDDINKLGIDITLLNPFYTYYFGDKFYTKSPYTHPIPKGHTSVVSKKTFKIIIVGNVDGDIFADLWAVNELGEIYHIIDDSSD